VRSIGFHASSGTIRYVVIEGTRSSPTVVGKARRPLQLIDDRPRFIQNAHNLFSEVIKTNSPDILAYIISMSATSKDQLASIVMPMGALNACALGSGLQCREFIAANFSKKFFKDDGISFVDRYQACDAILGVHPPNWTNSERQAALAALGAM